MRKSHASCRTESRGVSPTFAPTFAPKTLPGLLKLLTVFEFPQEVQLLDLQGLVIPKTKAFGASTLKSFCKMCLQRSRKS
jgi:hypothetical protein